MPSLGDDCDVPKAATLFHQGEAFEVTVDRGTVQPQPSGDLALVASGKTDFSQLIENLSESAQCGACTSSIVRPSSASSPRDRLKVCLSGPICCPHIGASLIGDCRLPPHRVPAADCKGGKLKSRRVSGCVPPSCDPARPASSLRSPCDGDFSFALSGQSGVELVKSSSHYFFSKISKSA
jgi:hypothetical protein